MKLQWQWHWVLQSICYVPVILFIGYFSDSPGYRPLSGQEAVIKLTLRHSGKLLGECRQRSEAELEQLPANMRIAESCPRERSPLRVELLLDGKLYYGGWLPPSGFQNDGMTSLYKRFIVPAVETNIEIRMKDHVDSAAFDYTLQRDIDLQPNRVLVIDFKASEKSFVIL
jgi:hypothetical protein